MSFETAELSNQSSAPVVLYEFKMGSNYWRYTSGDVALIANGQNFDPLVISDSGLVQSGDIHNDDVTITLPKSSGVVALFNGTPPSAPLYLYIRRKNRGQSDAPIIWVGNVNSAKITTAAAAELTCRMLTASFDRNGLRLCYTRGCPHALYDQNCQVPKSSYAVTLPIASLSGDVIIATGFASYASGWFSNGFIEWVLLPGVMERRAIEYHSGNVIQLLGATDGLTVGQYITAYPGCNRNTADCIGKYNNLLNYGGFPHMPGKSPFDGTPVF
jgi:uncharacterized phage protein (TIGR02218 family)